MSGFAGHFRKVCRGGIYCARRRVSEANRRTAAALRPEIPPGALRRRRVPGTMQASSPTGVCCNAGPRFLGWPRHSPSSVGADSISARGCLRRRRVRRDGGIPPYGRPEGGGRPCLARNAKFIRRGEIYPARGTLRRRGVRRDEGIPPYGRPGGLRLSGFAGHVRKVCRGGACPSRGALPYREHPREGHGPPLRTGTDATAIRLVRNTKFIRRGGFHIRPGPCGDAGFPGRSPA